MYTKSNYSSPTIFYLAVGFFEVATTPFFYLGLITMKDSAMSSEFFMRFLYCILYILILKKC